MTKTMPRHLLSDPPPPARLEERLEAVPDEQLPAADRRDRGHWWIVGMAVVGLVLVLGVGYLTTRGAAGLDLASQVTQACSVGQLPPGDRLCTKAAEVQTDPVALPKDGEDGAPGRGITSTTLVEGRLVVTYSDGTTTDVGDVTGDPGPAGRGITGTAVEAGRLVVTFTDGSRTDLGPIVGEAGPAGRGVASIAVVDGRLMVTYTDGTVQDAGPLPAGRDGKDGNDGDDGEDGKDAPVVQRQVFTLEDGRVRTCDRTGGTDQVVEYRCGPATVPPDPDPGPDPDETEGP